MRPQRDYRSASKEQFKLFKEAHPEVEITFEVYKNIIVKWNNAFATHILETGDRLKFPHGLGPLSISKYKPKTLFTEVNGVKYPKKPIDWGASNKEGKIIYHMNNVTDGMRYYWSWFPTQSYILHAVIWKFEMARVHSRQLAKYLKNPSDNHKDNYKQWIIKT